LSTRARLSLLAADALATSKTLGNPAMKTGQYTMMTGKQVILAGINTEDF